MIAPHPYTSPYEATRAAWGDATDWDKAVRLSRARAALRYPNRTAVADRDGAPHLVDLDTNRSHPL